MLGHRARLERGVEAFERLGIARQQQAARGIGVEPVDRHRIALKAEPQRAEMILKAWPARAGAFDGKAGGLVDDERFAVLEHYIDVFHNALTAVSMR